MDKDSCNKVENIVGNNISSEDDNDNNYVVNSNDNNRNGGNKSGGKKFQMNGRIVNKKIMKLYLKLIRGDFNINLLQID